MLQKFKHLHSFVFFLFLGAWMLQSISPLLIQQINQHHDEIMVCNIDGDCGAKCSGKGKKCSCRQTTSDKNDGSEVVLCGCDHNGNQPTVIFTLFEIKAIPFSGFSNTNHTDQYIFLPDDERHTFFFLEDIFRPPRLIA